jgi:hypothetical protein
LAYVFLIMEGKEKRVKAHRTSLLGAILYIEIWYRLAHSTQAGCLFNSFDNSFPYLVFVRAVF